MATPTLTNLNIAEQYRTALVDLTDMVVSGSGTISVLLTIDPVAGVLTYLPASSGNLNLDDLGFGQYQLIGTAAELTTSFANLGFSPTAGYFGTFAMQVQAENSEGLAQGSKTISFELLNGDALALGNGTDEIFLFKSVVGHATVDGGSGQDTLLVQNGSPLSIDFSQAGQQVTSGSPTVVYSGFENLDAQAASGAMTVVAASGGGTILTGSADDHITLGAGIDLVNTGAGSDLVKGSWSVGDNIALAEGGDSITFSNAIATVNGGDGTDLLVVTGSDPAHFDFFVAGNNSPDAAAHLSNFENLDASGASGALTVSLAAGSTSIVTGSGDDSIAFRDVVATVNAGSGSDTLVLDISKLSAPSASAALTINLAAAANTNEVTVGAPSAASWQNFENLDASTWDKNLTVTANAAGSVIATGSGVDTINTGAGADHVTTGDGDDRLNGVVGAGDDIDLGAGNDTATFATSATGAVRGGAGVDTLLFVGAAVTVNLATNTHFTGFENLSAAGATGVVNFIGVAGTTAVATGKANDVINVAAATDGVTINAGAGNNIVTGGAGADSITLGAGTDNIRAGGGNDVVRGNLTAGDRVLLEGGDDTISLPTSAIAVTVDGGSGSDTLIVRGSAAQTFNLGATDDNGTLAGTYTNFENISAAAATGKLTVTGVAGTTSIVTGSGADVITVAAAAQGVIINAGAGANTVTGSAFNDTITLGAGKDIINAGNGADTVNGALTSGDQVLLQGGNDTFLYRALTASGTLVDGGIGIDTLQYTGTTAKTFNFTSAADNVAAEVGLYKAFENLDANTASGAVTVTAAATTTRIVTGSGNDIITVAGATGNVRIDGGAGDDRITGGSHDDTIVYGLGTDTVDAGAGNDKLEIAAGAGALIIDLGVAAGSDQVNSASIYKNFENIDGAAADSALNITLGAHSSAVATGSGDDIVHTGAVATVTGAIALGAGEDSVVIDTTATSFSGVTLTDVEHLGLANNVDATLSIVQNALLDSAAGTNTVSLATAGTSSGAAEVETYRLANGVNDFTLGAAGQNVIGGSGNDTVHSDSLTTLGGTLALGGGIDSLVIDTTATNITAVTLSAVESIALATDVNASVTLAQNALLGNAAGNNTVTLSDAGVASGAAQVESYHLADGANSFTLGASTQNVTGGSGDDLFKSGTLTSISGSIDGVSGNDILEIDTDAALSATLSNIDAVTLADGVDLTTDIATANLITTATGTNSVTLSNGGTVVGVAQVESYRLANGGNSFTLGAAQQNVTGGSGDDVFNSATLTSITGTLTGGGGNDVLNIQGSTQLTATLIDIDTITIASNIDVTTNIADNALIGTAAGSNFVTLTDNGTLTGAAQIEVYRLADGGNSFTVGAVGQSVIGGSGDDTVYTGAFTTLTGTYTLAAGNDTVVVDSDGSNLSGATLTAVEHITLATGVDATVTLAQNALLGSAAGANSVTLSDAGTTTGAAEVEDYVLANGSNTFTLAANAQNVAGGSGDDIVHTAALLSITGTLALGAGNDSLVVDTTGTNIVGATLSSVESIALGNNVSATMTTAENALLSAATGINTVTLSNSGTANGFAAVENYQLANGGNSFTLGANAQSVTGGSGDDSFNTGAQTTVSGTLNGVSGNDVVNVEQNVTLGATLLNIDAVNLASNVALTTNLANNALVATATGVNTVSLNEAGTTRGAVQVENYVLANGSNSFTLGAAAQNVTGGSGDDTVHSGTLNTVSGTLALGGGNDRLVVDTTNTNIASAIFTSTEAVELASDVSITSNISNNALITTATGSNTVTLSDAGTATAAAQVENYLLANGVNSFTLAASAQNVTGGTGDDHLDSGSLTTISGSLDGVSGNDVLNIATSATLSATLANIDAVTLANNVNLTTSIANNTLLTTALGTNTVTLSNAGTASGAAQVESYGLANGSNTFTLGATAQSVTGGSGDDALKTGALTSISGTLDGVSGTDTLAIEQSASLSATLVNIDAVTLANNVNLTTTLANNALITSALGSNTVTLSAAGIASGAAQVESYGLANGANTFTLGATAQNIIGGSGDDLLKTGALTIVSGNLDGVSGTDTVAVEQSASLSATLANIDAVTLANNVNLITSIINNALITSALGTNTVTLSNAGTANGAAQVENYQLADGANNFTLGAAAQNVIGGTGDDVVHSAALVTLSGTLALAGGNDSLVIDTTGSNIAGMGLSAVETVVLANNVDATLTIAENALVGTASGINTLSLSDAGTAIGAAQVEAYHLANGGNNFTLGANGQNVTGGTGADVINVVDTQLSGAVLDGAGGRDTLAVTSSAIGVSTLAGAISNIEVIDLTGVANGASFTATAGVEEIHAGAGADTLNASAVTTGATITAGSGADTVTGGSGNDIIDVGVDANVDTVNAGGGSDTVTNFGAGDVINFEAGNDTATYAAVTATVDGGAAIDTLTVTVTTGAMTFDFTQVNAQQITAGGTGVYKNFENLAAGAAGVDDALTVTLASTTTAVTTGSGDDTITFHSQAVSVDAGAGADTLILGGSGVIVVDLSAAGDQVSGLGTYVNFENLDAAASSATLVAIAGQNTAFIKTGTGNDSLSGGVSLDGGNGNNNITADSRTTTVVAGGGNDNLDASSAAQAVTVNLGDGTNAVLGSSHGDIITLGAGADTISAGAGSDIIIGTLSAGDLIDLGADDDNFTYQALGSASMSVDGGTGTDTLTVGVTSGAMIIDLSNSTDQIAAEAGSYKNFENLAAGSASNNLTVTTAASGGHIVTGSGDDDVTLSAVANTTVETGAGDDVINVTAATINGSIDAGSNTGVGDTLNVLGGGALGMSVTAIGIENVSLAVATDFTANGLSGLNITGSSGNDIITVGAADQLVAGAGGDDVVKVTAALLSASLHVDGGTQTVKDTLVVTTDAAVVDADLVHVSGIEVLKLVANAADNAQSVILGANATTGGLTTVDATAVGADDNITINAAAFGNALTVNTAAGSDVITLGSGGSVVDAGNGANTVTVGAANDGVHNDAITTGSGVDLIKTTDAQLTASLSVAAGSGSDTLQVTDDASLADADLAHMSGLEILKLSGDAGDNAQSVSLAANAETAGITTLDTLAAGADDAISVDASSFDNALTVNTGAGDDVITLGTGGSVVVAGNGHNTVTVGAANDGVHDDDITLGSASDLIQTLDAHLSAHLRIAAGTGNDTLEVVDDASVVDADLTQLTSIEILKLSANAGDNAQSVTVASHAAAMGLTVIDASAVGTDDVINIDATGFANALTILTSSGDDVISLGTGGTVVHTNDGNDRVTAGAASDDIATGAGDDTINVTATTIAAAIDGGANTASGDTLHVTGGGAVVMGASVVHVEKITLAVATDFTANGTSALDITGSAGADTITVGAGDQVIAGAGGDDIIKLSSAQLSSSLFVNGGADSVGDTLQVTSDAAVTDSDLANISNIEILKLSGDAVDDAQSVVLDTNAASAGLAKIDATAVGSHDAITLDALSFANALTVNTGAGDDLITLGAGGSVVNAGTGDNTVSIGAANDGVHDDHITSGAGADIFNVTDAQLSAALTIAAGGGIDTLRITTDASVVDADLAGLSGLEVLHLVADAGDDAQSVVLAANAQSAGITTIEASVGATDAVSVDASGFLNALHVDTLGGDDVIVLGAGGSVVNAGNGANTVTVGAANDNVHKDVITTGSGDDLIRVADDKLTSFLSVAASAGNDTLEVTSDANVDDSDFTLLAGLETLKLSADALDNHQALVLATHAMATGLTSVDTTAVGSNDAVLIDTRDFNSALTINSGAGDDVIMLGAAGSVVNAGDGVNQIVVGAANDGVHDDNLTTGAGVDFFILTNAQFTSHLVINGGGASDALRVVDDAAVTDADFSQISAVERLQLTGLAADGAQSIVVATHAMAAGLSAIEINGPDASEVVTLDASGFANFLNINTDGSRDIVTLGSGGSAVHTGDGDDIVTVGAANDGVHDDLINTGAGADLINLTDAQLSAHLVLDADSGVDTLKITTDASVVDADLAHLTSVEIIKLVADAGDDAQSITLAANAMAAGISTVDASLAGGSDTVTVDASAYTQNLTVMLHAGIDNVTLGAGNDTLLGGVTTGDTINLGAGNDSFAMTTLALVTIDGGSDLDSLVIGAGAGSRQIDFSNSGDQLSGAGVYLNFENLSAADANGQLSVIAGSDTTSIITGSKIDQVDAGLASHGVSIATGASGDAIIGSAHNDTIDAGAGDDFIAGGAGNDALTGGSGGDTFVFDTALNASTNVDTLSDFVSGSDLFQLNLDIFTALHSTGGVLNANNFVAGTGAVASTVNQHVILDTTSGSLFYDADGVGGVAQIEFARLAGAHLAVATDFVIG